MRNTNSIIAGITALLFSGILQAAPAPDGNSVLILADTNGGSRYSNEATTQGFTVVSVSDADWATYTQADFESFRAIIMGDPTCTGGTDPIAPAEANKALWSAAVGGAGSPNPKLFIGTDEVFHFGSGGSALISSGIAFVTSEPALTGLYISLSCYYDSITPGTPAPVFDEFGAFTVGEAVGCFDDSHIVADHPALAGLTDESLSNWSCSVHNVFNSFPASFIPLAIAEGQTGLGEMSFPDGSNGVPYILASGAGIVTIGESVPVPALSTWMLMVLAGLLLAMGWRFRATGEKQH